MKTKTEYLTAVKNELFRIRQLTTPEQKSRLIPEYFDPDDAFKCVYGLLYGYAWCLEALNAKNRFAEHYRIKYDTMPYQDFVEIQRVSDKHWATPLEHYLNAYPQDNDAIVDYLRKETDQLQLRMLITPTA